MEQAWSYNTMTMLFDTEINKNQLIDLNFLLLNQKA